VTRTGISVANDYPASRILKETGLVGRCVDAVHGFASTDPDGNIGKNFVMNYGDAIFRLQPALKEFTLLAADDTHKHTDGKTFLNVRLAPFNDLNGDIFPLKGRNKLYQYAELDVDPLKFKNLHDIISYPEVLILSKVKVNNQHIAEVIFDASEQAPDDEGLALLESLEMSHRFEVPWNIKHFVHLKKEMRRIWMDLE